MSEIVLPTEVTRVVDWNNPLTANLEALLYCDGTNVIDAVTGEIAATLPSSTGTDVNGTWWEGMVDFDLRNTNISQNITGASIWYLFFGIFRTTSAGTLSDHAMWTVDGYPSSVNIYFNWDGVWSTRYAKIAGNYASDNLENTVYMGESLAYHSYGLRLGFGISGRTYIYTQNMLDGVLGQNNNSAQSGSTAERYLFRVGSAYKTYIVPIFKHVTDDEAKIAEIQANPYQLFESISTGTEQSTTTVTTQQLTQSEIVSVIGIGFSNAIISQSITQSQLVNINETAQLNAIVSEQKTQSSLQAIATINNVSPVICEQLNESSTVSNEATQLVYAVQAQQLTQSLTLNIASDGTQDVNAIVTEQKSHSQIITLEEVASIKAVICEQLVQAVNANVSAINETNAITAEQLSQSITVSVDESSGIFVSVVHTEQLSQSTLADINADSIVNAIITQQLTQTSTQHINVDITLDAVICEQLTHAELITIIEQNISQQLSIDIDKITIETLTPTHEIEMLTPKYTIENL